MKCYTKEQRIEWIIKTQQQMDDAFSIKIILSVEARFHHDGFLNRHKLKKYKCSNKVSLFGAHFGLEL